MYFGGNLRFVEPLETRHPRDYPYNYDTFYLWGERIDGAQVLYSDRMARWDHEGRPGQYRDAMLSFRDKSLSEFTPEDASQFLSEYLKKPIEAIALAQTCNQANGFPYWIFYYLPKDGGTDG